MKKYKIVAMVLVIICFVFFTSCGSGESELKAALSGGADADSDGVIITVDLCPDTPLNTAVNENGCSDSDGDGIAENLDICANTQPGVSVNENGCAFFDPDDYHENQITGMKFNHILVNGSFLMGSPANPAEPGRGADEIQHEVIITKSYYMQTTEVTQGQWQAVMVNKTNPSQNLGCAKCPLEMLSWENAQEFITALNDMNDGIYRLPTEAEWEYAARAGSTTAFANGDITEPDDGFDENLDKIGWYNYNISGSTQLVGQKEPNVWGLYDMHGNVRELCSDIYGSYLIENINDPVGPPAGNNRVVRGGSWNENASACRAANREGLPPVFKANNTGIRLVWANDTDNDGVEDAQDTCNNTPINEDADVGGCSNSQKDSDDDSLNDKMEIDYGTDPFDSDSDDDLVWDADDAFPLNATEQFDTDNDGIGNNKDDDDDNDGVVDKIDAFHLDKTEQFDTDADGIGNNKDFDDDNDGLDDIEEDLNQNGTVDHGETDPLNDDTDIDGIKDKVDNCPTVSNYFQNNFDEDEKGDVCDNDDDNDGLEDTEEDLNQNGTVDHGETNPFHDDTDTDDVKDKFDNCPTNSNSAQNDYDEDGKGDVCDNDDDDDEVLDNYDNCKTTPPKVTVNSEGCTDSDGDEIEDSIDNCPNISNSDQDDFDRDGKGNFCDDDDDGDTVSDNFDHCPKTQPGTYVDEEGCVFPLPDTGQMLCYDNTCRTHDGGICPSPSYGFYGQDAQYSINSPSYTKLNSSGIELPDTAPDWTMVKDNITGLIWEVKTDDGLIHDKDKQYTWYNKQQLTGTQGNETDTEDFINGLNNTGFGGYTDWRIPTVTELQSIVDYGQIDKSAINADYFPNTIDNNSQYWTSTTDSGNDFVWYVNFSNGSVFNANTNSNYYIRAVRGTQPAYSFTDKDGTITDNKTGLMWMKSTADIDGDNVITSEDAVSWERALYYCENLVIASYSDWRLPNVKELKSIVNNNRLDPSIDEDLFSNTMSNYYWSSTTYANYPCSAWHVNFYDGLVNLNVNYKSNSYYVRAVRGGK